MEKIPHRRYTLRRQITWKHQYIFTVTISRLSDKYTTHKTPRNKTITNGYRFDKNLKKNITYEVFS